MAFLFVDGFDHYTSVDPPTKWSSISNPGSSTILVGPTYKRFGTNGAMTKTNQSGFIKSVGLYSDSMYMGVAFKQVNLSVYNPAIFTVLLVGTIHIQIGFATGSTPNIIATRGELHNGTVLGNFGSEVGVWHYIEAQVKIHLTTGICKVWYDGVLQIDFSGQTRYTGSVDGLDSIRLGGGIGYNAASGEIWLDDFWLDNAQRHGDCQIIYRNPSGAGFYTQFDPSAGSNYQCVDDTVPDPAGDYVSTTVTDEIDSYAMTDITQSAGTVKAVVGNYYCQKTDAGARQLDMLTRLSSADLLTGAPKAIPASWGFLQLIQETKPGGGAWSVQDTKDAEMGMKLEV